MPALARLGCALSSEEHRPADLVEDARRAEAAGGPHLAGFVDVCEREVVAFYR